MEQNYHIREINKESVTKKCNYLNVNIGKFYLKKNSKETVAIS